ncbi:TetR/AcrR family transcriptional regulator [Microbacteriaceae bacterium VKM Ac-2854]|nr:TetR/AcrR family transcriptional regulator [Microbacteriaceae bacterium VKM Ac-2854]
MDAATDRDQTRNRIIEVAAGLLREHGPSAVTTRRVAADAGVQAPMIYRIFGDKDGLLEAVAENVMAGFVSAKAATVAAASAEQIDPFHDLESGWRAQIAFGLENPTLFRLLSEPDRVRDSPAAASGKQVLERRVRRVAATGRLRVSERRAVDLIQAAGTGVIQTLLATPIAQRELGLADDAYQAVMARILTDGPSPRDGDSTAAIVAFRATVSELAGMSPAERGFMTEWLDRLIAQA